MNDDRKDPFDQVLDLLVYAPIGFVLSARDLVSQAAEKGRQHAMTARMVGQYALQQEAPRLVNQLREQAEGLGQLVGGRPAAPSPPPAPSSPAGAAAPAASAPPTQTGAPAARPDTTTETRPRLDPSSLAIPGYDTLSASQVVQRLAGLSTDELEAVRSYEEASRGRKTVLAKVEQLQSG